MTHQRSPSVAVGQIDSKIVSWDGKMNGIESISDDYWFTLTRQDGREYKGHFALKR
jgi:gliding motility-associated-like protein